MYSNVIEEQTVPKTPQLKTPDISQPGKVTLTWSDNHGVNTFIIYREQASSGSPEVTGTLIATVNGSTMKYTVQAFLLIAGPHMDMPLCQKVEVVLVLLVQGKMLFH